MMTAAIPKYYCPPELYDLIYSDVVADIAPLVAEARAARGPVLEACCGNGRLMIPMREAGLDVDGLDLDPAMLTDLKRKLAARSLAAGLHHADMRDFALPRRYRMILIPFNSFGHNLTQDDQIATMRCCREHLDDGGHLTIVMFHPSGRKLLQFDGTPIPVKEIPSTRGPGTVRVTDSVVSERVEQINTVTRRVELIDPRGSVTETHEFGFQIRYIWKPEMELLLKAAGYGRWRARPLFKSLGPEPLGDDSAPEIAEGDMLAWSAWKV